MFPILKIWFIFSFVSDLGFLIYCFFFSEI